MISRILFDRSICHKDKFDALKRSSLTKALASKRIRLLYTPIFIEETLQYGLDHSTQFKKQWKYLISLNDSYWFKTTNNILAIELGNKVVGRKYYLRDVNEIHSIL